MCPECIDNIVWAPYDYRVETIGTCKKCSKKWNLIEFLLEKYKGLRIKDFQQGNESYSCVICGDKECEKVGVLSSACERHQAVSIEEFVARYDFNVED